MINVLALIELFKQALAEGWGYIWGTAGIMWTSARQKQKVSYMVSKYGEDWKKNADAKNDNYYYAALYGSKWIGHMVSDCSGLFAWAFKKLGGAIAHGSNSIYDRYCTTKGRLNDSLKKTIVPGTAVFTGDANKHGHIGLYVGNGKVIEASGTQAGVCVSNITANKWTYYGLLKNVDYGASEGQEQPPVPSGDKQSDKTFPTLKRGSKGEYVTLLQTKLIQKGYDLGKWGADGDFGSQTEKAVKEFQKDHGLNADGVVGAKTWEAIDKASTNLYVVTIPHLPKFKAEALIKDYSGASMKEE